MASLGCCSTFLIGEPQLTLSSRRSLLSPTSFPLQRKPPALVLPTAAVAKPTAATTEKRQPRGITKPKPISPVLQELLGVPEIPRTQALKQIWAYIKQHNLQDPENKKIIVCDEKLKNIFGRDRVGFLEISGLLNPHFVK